MRHLSAILFLLCFGSILTADDLQTKQLDNWHHWRGPLANGFAPNANPPLQWSETKNVKWKVDLPGIGTSTPIVWGERIYLLTAIDTGKQAKASDVPKPDPRFQKLTEAPTTYHQYVVLCLDRQSGKTLWKQIATEAVPHEGHHPSHTHCGFSPMTDGKFLYVSFGTRGTFCYDLDGKLQWKRDLGVVHTRKGWGEATPPLVYGDHLIVNADSEGDSRLFVLDAKTGKTKWSADREEPTTWATPIVVKHKGVEQLIVSGTNRVRSYNLQTGKVIWECGGQTVNAIPSPIVREGVVYCMSGYRGQFACAIPLDSKGDVTNSKDLLWTHKRGTPYVPSPLLYQDRLYFTQSNRGILTMVDATTGKVILDRERLPGIGGVYASPVAAKDRIYVTGRDGTTVVLQAGDKLKVLAKNELEAAIDASPVLIGNQLLLRGQRRLYCIEEK